MTVTTDEKVDLLRRVDLFAQVEPRHLERIAEACVEVDAKPGSQIVREGDVGTGFFVIVSGSVSVRRDGGVIAVLGAGDFFGELSVLDGQPRVAQVVANEATRCLALPSWELERVLLDEPTLALALLRRLASRLRTVTEASRH
jgi:CRP/FNR family transcriptional regulator, cyclic AMP receptor protein